MRCDGCGHTVRHGWPVSLVEVYCVDCFQPENIETGAPDEERPSRVA